MLANISRIGGLAYNFILARKFETALDAADQAISLAPEQIWFYASRTKFQMDRCRCETARQSSRAAFSCPCCQQAIELFRVGR